MYGAMDMINFKWQPWQTETKLNAKSGARTNKPPRSKLGRWRLTIIKTSRIIEKARVQPARQENRGVASTLIFRSFLRLSMAATNEPTQAGSTKSLIFEGNLATPMLRARRRSPCLSFYQRTKRPKVKPASDNVIGIEFHSWLAFP